MNASTLSSLIRSRGRAVTLRRRVLPDGAPTDTVVSAVSHNVTRQVADGVTILTGEREYLIDSVNLSPAPTPDEYSVVEGAVERPVTKVRTLPDRSSVIGYVLTTRE